MVRILLAALMIPFSLFLAWALASSGRPLFGTVLMFLGIFVSMMILPSRFRKKLSMRYRDHGKDGYILGGLIRTISVILMAFSCVLYYDAVDPTGNFIPYFLLFIIGWLTVVAAEPIVEVLNWILRTG